jgi:hypothetical protein
VGGRSGALARPDGRGVRGHPVVINVHPYTIKERMPSIKFLIETGVNPEIILTKGLFRLGSFRSSKETEEELEAIVSGYERFSN